MTNKIPPEHPRAESLRTREMLIEGFREGIVTLAGLIAHGRGEAFDYLLGEKTTKPALKATEAAAAAMLNAEKGIISVNGNTAALAAKHIAELAKISKARIEVNLFYRSLEREEAIKKLLIEAGAEKVLGAGKDASARIPELSSERRRVDPHGILIADVVLVPLEDGDRTEALVKMGKKIIAIDLNPLSRTAQKATITIVDNVVRAIPKLMETAEKLKKESADKREKILQSFDNKKNLSESIAFTEKRLAKIAKVGEFLVIGEEQDGL